jgi:hypothetical protein
MAYESLTEQEQYEMWVHYLEMCRNEEQEKNKTDGLTSNNVNPADIALRETNEAETTRRSLPDRTGDLTKELSLWLDS